MAVLAEILAAEPDNVIVGGSIMNAENQRETAKALYEMIHSAE